MRTVGPTPLEYAASLGDTESIKYLLDEGALPNMASNVSVAYQLSTFFYFVIWSLGILTFCLSNSWV